MNDDRRHADGGMFMEMQVALRPWALDEARRLRAADAFESKKKGGD